MTTPVTCGIFLVDPEGKILIVHSTNARWNQWGIPKGMPNPGEGFKAAATRELEEETSLKISELLKSINDLKYLGAAEYAKQNKRLEAYWALLDQPITMEDLVCTSMVVKEGKPPFPEVNKFMTVSLDDADKWLHQTQVDLLPRLREEVAKARLQQASKAIKSGKKIVIKKL